MQSKGLNVKGLNSTEISRKLEKYVADYFTGYELGAGQFMFQESHLFWLEEISGMLPEHYFRRFTDNDKFSTMYSFFSGNEATDNTTERVLMLLLDEQSEYVYLLCLQETGGAATDDDIGAKRFTSISRGSLFWRQPK